jgi:putative peptidoglycan lipid II flippase
MTSAALLLASCSRLILPLIAATFSPEKLQLTDTLMLTLLPWLPMGAAIAVWRAVLNVCGMFALPAILPIATPLVTMLALVLTAHQIGIHALAVALVTGALIELLLLARAVHARGGPILFAWDGWTPEVSALWRQCLPLIATAALTSACIMVDQAVAARLGPGTVSALSYGTRLVTVMISIAATAVSTAVLPVFSRLWSVGNYHSLRRAAGAYTIGAIVFSIPITAILIASSETIVRTFFQRGAFDAADTSTVATVLRYALLQVPFAMGFALVVKLATAVSATQLLLSVSMIAFIGTVTGDLVFAGWFGVAGIPLATAMVQALSLMGLIALLWRKEPRLFA